MQDLTPATAPAFVRAPRPPVAPVLYVAMIHSAKHGAFSPETDAADCIAQVARACAEACADTDDAGIGHWDRWEVREFHTGKDVTADAVRALVAFYRRHHNARWIGRTLPSYMVAPSGMKDAPAWWQEHDATLCDWELDTWEAESA